MARKLLQLLELNRGIAQRKPAAQMLVVRAATDTAPSEATMYMYGPIVEDQMMAEWCGGICPQDFSPAVRGLSADVKTLHLHIDSPGGDVFATEAMVGAMADFPGEIVAHIEGVCASAATTIACAADKVFITAGSFYMIHQAWTIALGNATEMRSTAELLDKCDQVMLDTYVGRTGAAPEALMAQMAAETWFKGSEAVDAGFADAITPARAKASSRRWDLSAYARAPELPKAEPAPAEPEFISEEHQARLARRARLAAMRFRPES